MKKANTFFCLTVSFPSIEKVLLDGLHLSKSQIKKFHFSRKFLQQESPRGKEVHLPLDLLNHGHSNPAYCGPPIEVLYEDKEVIALNKPPGIHCHPLKYLEHDNCVSFLREKLFLKKSDFCFEQDFEKGLIYRIDGETSGVIIFCRKKEHYQLIRRNFKELVRKKTYLAIVPGEFKDVGSQRGFFYSTGAKGAKITVKEGPLLKNFLGEGELFLKVLDYKSGYTLLEIELKTGIRHQIRAWLAHLGHPILGDEFYGGRVAERMFLHAYQYGLSISGQDLMLTAKKAYLFDKFFDLDRIL